jgi:ATP-dependent helicase/DNAse subunit B
VPLKFVTGSANAGKAGEILRAYRARLDDDPVLVVPRAEDVEHTRRELVEAGAVLGGRVVRFGGLLELAAERVEPALGAAARVGGFRRELLVAEAVRRAPLRTIRGSAARPGFARAGSRFLAELGRSLIDPARFEAALAEWAGAGSRRTYAEDLAALYVAYRGLLEEVGVVDDELFARRVLDALRREPHRFGRTPVFVYGFDSFTAVELDAVETLARRTGAEVTVSLPFERGRVAFRASASAFALLSEVADEHQELPASDVHYAPGSRAGLAAIERGLFETPPAPDARPSPGAALGLHLAGGERAEVELAGNEVLRALRAGVAPGDIAVVARDPAAAATIVEDIFGAYGIPFSLERERPLAHTALGRGLVALLRCAGDGGRADDLVAYLRTPGRLRVLELADELEADARRAGIDDAPRARALWESRRWPLRELDRLAAARGHALLEAVEGEVERLLAASRERSAPVLAGAEAEDASAVRAARAALADIAALVGRGIEPSLDAGALADLLTEVPVRTGEPPGPGRVRVAAPEAVRARRYDMVVVLGLQEGEFPRRPTPEPFLSDDVRREVAEATGLALPIREDELDRERHLFHACVSRAERRLVLSARTSDEEGAPTPPSFFLEEVRGLFRPQELEDVTVRRTLAEVTWRPEEAPTAIEHTRSVAARGPRAPEAHPEELRAPALLAALAERRSFSAGELETLAGCGVRWLVEKVVRPARVEPDPAALVRGRYAHEVLRVTFERLRERTGSARIAPDSLPAAEELLGEALDELAYEHRISVRDGRTWAARRRLEADLRRLLRREAESGASLKPDRFEVGFGIGPAELPPLVLEPEGIDVRGRIDRVDTRGRRAVVRDYKGGARVDGVAAWEEEGRLQVAVYMLAVRELLDLEPVGGLYVPLAGRGQPRGVVASSEAEAVGRGTSRNDVLGDEEVDALLGRTRARIAETVAGLRAGDVRPCPERCGPRGRCSYPAVCREPEAA